MGNSFDARHMTKSQLLKFIKTKKAAKYQQILISQDLEFTEEECGYINSITLINSMSNKEIIEQKIEKLFDEEYFKKLKSDKQRDEYLDKIFANNRNDENCFVLTTQQLKNRHKKEISTESAVMSVREIAYAKSVGIEWSYGGIDYN